MSNEPRSTSEEFKEQPEELAPAYAFLASAGDSSSLSGSLIQVTGGRLASE